MGGGAGRGWREVGGQETGNTHWTWQPKGQSRKDASVRTPLLILAHQQLYYYANTYKIWIMLMPSVHTIRTQDTQLGPENAAPTLNGLQSRQLCSAKSPLFARNPCSKMLGSWESFVFSVQALYWSGTAKLTALLDEAFRGFGQERTISDQVAACRRRWVFQLQCGCKCHKSFASSWKYVIYGISS